MYYIWSIIISTILFAIIQYNEYLGSKKNNTKHIIFSLKNIGILLILYIICTIRTYMLFSEDDISPKFKNSISQNGGGKSNDTYLSIDPHTLRKISDEVNIGFKPTKMPDDI